MIYFRDPNVKDGGMSNRNIRVSLMVLIFKDNNYTKRLDKQV